jgi:hypothetical protein
MFDPEIVVAILAFVGIGVVGLTEMIKRLLHADGALAYVISAVVSAAATAFTLAQSDRATGKAYKDMSHRNGVYLKGRGR